MAGTVESSIVLNAVDNTKSALNSVQSNLEKLVHKATEVSNGFSKIWTEWMSWFQLQTTKALNEVNRLTKYLSGKYRNLCDTHRWTSSCSKYVLSCW